MANYKLCETLKELRNHKRLTQKAVSVELNMTPQTYSNYETGHRIPDLETACRLAEYYNVSLDQLVITGIHPQNVDPFASLPLDYQELIRSYHELTPDQQKTLRIFIKALAQQ